MQIFCSVKHVLGVYNYHVESSSPASRMEAIFSNFLSLAESFPRIFVLH